MSVGERRRAWIPDALGYQGRPGSPRGVTVFDLELLEIVQSVQLLPAPVDVRQPPAQVERSKSGLRYRHLQNTLAAADGAGRKTRPKKRRRVLQLP
jgi:hypothetical protein